jgi:hypothetical protein
LDKQDWIGALVLLGGISILLWLLAKVIRAVAVVLGKIYESSKKLTAAAVAEIERPSHLLYLSLFAVGAIGSARRVIQSFASSTQSESSIRLVLFWSLWAFFTTNILQQYLIYRTCISAEIVSSDTSKRYGPWWVGTVAEKLLRIVVVVLLLGVAGEIYHFEGADQSSVTAIARLNMGLFLLFALWNVAALSKSKSSTATLAGANILLRKHVFSSMWLNLFAVALWGFVLLSTSRTDALAFMILTAVLYAFLVVTIHVREAPWNRSVFISVVGIVFLVYMTGSFYPSVISEIRTYLAAVAPGNRS